MSADSRGHGVAERRSPAWQDGAARVVPPVLQAVGSCQAPKRLTRRYVIDLHCPLSASARSKFYIREPPHDRPDWLKVGLTLGTSAFLWIY
ncbi:hypothetical protein GH733_012039, partial [Mirounga leonina]